MAEKVVRAERLELVDAQGRVRAALSCEEDTGLPTCAFFDSRGEARVIVGLAWNELPQIQLNAPDGTARLALVVRPEGMGMVVLADDERRSRTITPEES